MYYNIYVFLFYHLQGHQTTFMPIPMKVEVTYKYEELFIDNIGPAPPSLDDVKHKGYIFISLYIEKLAKLFYINSLSPNSIFRAGNITAI